MVHDNQSIANNRIKTRYNILANEMDFQTDDRVWLYPMGKTLHCAQADQWRLSDPKGWGRRAKVVHLDQLAVWHGDHDEDLKPGQDAQA